MRRPRRYHISIATMAHLGRCWRLLCHISILMLVGCYGAPPREQLTWPADGAVLEQVQGSMLLGEAAGVAADAVPSCNGAVTVSTAGHRDIKPVNIMASGWPGWSARQLAALRGEDPPARDESQ